MSEIKKIDKDFIINNSHREKMNSLEKSIYEELDRVELEEKHYFAQGTYTRELHIPEGTVLTGKIHKHSCINILSKGKIKVVTDEGTYDIEAPYTFVSGPGVKKAGFALEDSVWINVHPWNGEDDLEELERRVIIPSYEALESEMRLLPEENKQ